MAIQRLAVVGEGARAGVGGLQPKVEEVVDVVPTGVGQRAALGYLALSTWALRRAWRSLRWQCYFSADLPIIWHRHKCWHNLCGLSSLACLAQLGEEGRAEGESKLAKYLIHGSYTLEGLKGLLGEGGSSRRDTVEKSIANLGGKIEAFYYAFGSDDVYGIFEMPDNVSASAFALAVAGGGGFKGSTVVLLTPEEIDQATKKIGSVAYRAPGQGR